MELSNVREAVNKTEIAMFTIGRVYIFKAIANAQLVEEHKEAEQIITQLFETMMNDF